MHPDGNNVVGKARRGVGFGAQAPAPAPDAMGSDAGSAGLRCRIRIGLRLRRGWRLGDRRRGDGLGLRLGDRRRGDGLGLRLGDGRRRRGRTPAARRARVRGVTTDSATVRASIRVRPTRTTTAAAAITRARVGAVRRRAMSAGDPVGHVVAIGHDYRSFHAAMTRILGNAIALGRNTTVRVGWYRGTADVTVRGFAAARAAGVAGLMTTGRLEAVTLLAQLPNAAALASLDVVVVDPQRAPTTAMRSRRPAPPRRRSRSTRPARQRRGASSSSRARAPTATASRAAPACST